MKILHYVNQFFAGIGGEEEALIGFDSRPGPIGPGNLLKALLQQEVHEADVMTAFCGDTFAAEHVDEVVAHVVRLVEEERPDCLVLGPAFSAGRYGLICGELAARIPALTGVHAVTGMSEENAAVGIFRTRALIVRTGRSAAGMKEAMDRIASVVLKLVGGMPIEDFEEEGLFGVEIRRNRVDDKTAADRAIDMLLELFSGVDAGTELALPDYESVPASAPVSDLSRSTVALVTEGGLVPRENPDGLTSGGSERWGAYDIADLLDNPGNFQSIHGGYDTKFVNESPFRLVPADVVSSLVAEGRIGKLHPRYYVTSGTSTKVANCRMMGSQIAQVLRNEGVDAVILTST